MKTNRLCALAACLLPLMILTSGCTTLVEETLGGDAPVEYKFATTKFILPEANGALFHGRAQVTVPGVHNITLIDDMDSTTYSTSPSISSTFDINGMLDMGLFSRMDFFYSDGIGAKFQVLGDPRMTAKAGNVAVSLVFKSREFEDTQSHDDSTGSVKSSKAKVNSQGHEYMLVAGKRINDAILFYSGVYYSESTVRVHLSQSNNTNYNVDGYPTKGEGNSKGVVLGFNIDNSNSILNSMGWTVGLEAAYAETKWKRTYPSDQEADSQKGFSVGGSTGLTW